MKLIFQRLLKKFENMKKEVASVKKRSFIKTDRQIFTIIGIAFAISVVSLLCYWLFKERPYYENLLTDKNEVIKTLKFTRDKQKKIYENAVADYEEKLANEYVLKSMYDEKVNDYEQRLNYCQNNSISISEHEKLSEELRLRLKEETSLKEELEQKTTVMEQKVSILEDKNLDLKATIGQSLEFIQGEKDKLEIAIFLERKKALIPSLILPETKNSALNADTLKKLVVIKDKLKNLEEMNIVLKPDTYFEMGIVSYYNKQYNEAIELWENAVSLNKNNLKACICLGIVYNEQGMSDNAVKVLERAMEINPKYATIHLALARIYEQKGIIDDAIYEYSKALEINPEPVDIHNTLGILYEKKGLKEEAKKSFTLYEKLMKENR